MDDLEQVTFAKNGVSNKRAETGQEAGTLKVNKVVRFL